MPEVQEFVEQKPAEIAEDPAGAGDALGLPAVVSAPGLYVVHLNGKGLRRLVDGSVGRPSWSPDGTRVAYVGPDGGVEIVDLDGNRTPLGARISTADAAPSWSPDSRWLAFPGPGTASERDPWISDASGINRARRIDFPGDDAEVVWGPDGRLAAMGTNLSVFTADGMERTVIHATGGWGPLKWSPNGRSLVALPNSTAIDLLIDADGTNPRTLGDSGTVGLSIWDADWAPSNDRLVYSEDARRTGRVGIGIAPADGRPGTRIADDISDPAWCPTGEIIAGVVEPSSSPLGLAELVHISPDGITRMTIAQSILQLRDPAWAPNGPFIAFAAGGTALDTDDVLVSPATGSPGQGSTPPVPSLDSLSILRALDPDATTPTTTIEATVASHTAVGSTRVRASTRVPSKRTPQRPASHPTVR